MDIEAIQIIRLLEGLKIINISGCQLLTDFFIQSVISLCKDHRIQLKMNKTKFSQNIME